MRKKLLNQFIFVNWQFIFRKDSELTNYELFLVYYSFLTLISQYSSFTCVVDWGAGADIPQTTISNFCITHSLSSSNIEIFSPSFFSNIEFYKISFHRVSWQHNTFVLIRAALLILKG